MPTPFEAFFLPVEGAKPGQRFCIFHPADGLSMRGAVLYIHPFAEEMNKSRRMAALQSRALAQAGFAVLQIDLLGCGDSSGDFGDATWQDWLDDVVRAARWLQQRFATTYAEQSRAPLWLWGLRSGCLLAAQAAHNLDHGCNLLLWQPPASGKPLLHQFMRLKMAGDLIGGQGKGVMDQMRKQLAAGQSIEIAGYHLSSGLAHGLELALLTPPPKSNGVSPKMVLFEVSSRDDASLSPISTTTVERWQQAGFESSGHTANGPAFWQTTEIEDAPALVAATTTALCQ